MQVRKADTSRSKKHDTDVDLRGILQGRCSYIWGEDAAETPEACEAIFAKRKAEQKLAKARSAAGQESGPDT
jgi:hypothetical protein